MVRSHLAALGQHTLIPHDHAYPHIPMGLCFHVLGGFKSEVLLLAQVRLGRDCHELRHSAGGLRRGPAPLQREEARLHPVVHRFHRDAPRMPLELKPGDAGWPVGTAHDFARNPPS